ncbi:MULTISPECIES: alkaline phosphatase family protein [unclassified Nonomuraea]|uniref:alkaline phosphatase family protein n=1 Tax=unclassified Nonomuraea TaxID=2593643 RepID=UPI003407A57E
MRRTLMMLALLIGLTPLLTSPAAAATLAYPCGWRSAAPQTYDHVIWIWLENTSYGQLIGNKDAPAFNLLAHQCGTATSYYGMTHPSFRNYIAATSGVDWHGAPASCDPGVPDYCYAPFPSILDQVKAQGREWRIYSDGMPENCRATDAEPYVVHHNPAPYYPQIADDCARWNVPAGTPRSGALHDDLGAGTLPAFSFLVADKDHDISGTEISAGDTWLGGWLLRILSSRAYLSGKTAVIVSFDEGYGLGTDEECVTTRSETCHVPTFVVSPSTRPGAKSDVFFNHYSLLRTTEELLGIPDHLEQAGDPATQSMRSAFTF